MEKKENLKFDYNLEEQPKIGKGVVKINVLQPNVIIMLKVSGGGIIFLKKGESYITDKYKIKVIDKFYFNDKQEMKTKINSAISLLQGNNQ